MTDSALGLNSGKLTLSPYRKKWPGLYNLEKTRLLEVVGAYLLRIEHVGSTAVPGMPAKPILDIAGAVRALDDVEDCIVPLQTLGYEFRGEQGVPGRRYFVKGEPRTHHLHLYRIGSRAWEDHLLFRDWLSSHPQAAVDYAVLKTRLLVKYPEDRAAYTDGKAPFIERILTRARQETG
jgi:GrpB-like predicted nucleotidyltransferase (UPF0157 family)